MRYETCIVCSYSQNEQISIISTMEMLSPFMHHHHIVDCSNCGKWWFDDVSLNALGIPTARRRDTEFCECDETQEFYTGGIITASRPENLCNCNARDIGSHMLRIGE